MSARARLLALLVVTALAASACSAGGEPEAPETSSSRTPGDPTTSWHPAAPAEPVDPAGVASTYDVVLEAVVAALPPHPQWSGSTTRTEELEGTCAVTLERTAPGPVPPPGDDTLDLSALAQALDSHGFADLAMADDPGGALRYLAHDSDDALFELRSKDTTTVAVRVPTTADSCAG